MRSDEAFHDGTKCVAFTIANLEAEFRRHERSVVRCRAGSQTRKTIAIGGPPNADNRRTMLLCCSNLSDDDQVLVPRDPVAGGELYTAAYIKALKTLVLSVSEDDVSDREDGVSGSVQTVSAFGAFAEPHQSH